MQNDTRNGTMALRSERRRDHAVVMALHYLWISVENADPLQVEADVEFVFFVGVSRHSVLDDNQ